MYLCWICGCSLDHLNPPPTTYFHHGFVVVENLTRSYMVVGGLGQVSNPSLWRRAMMDSFSNQCRFCLFCLSHLVSDVILTVSDDLCSFLCADDVIEDLVQVCYVYHHCSKFVLVILCLWQLYKGLIILFVCANYLKINILVTREVYLGGIHCNDSQFIMKSRSLLVKKRIRGFTSEFSLDVIYSTPSSQYHFVCNKVNIELTKQDESN